MLQYLQNQGELRSVRYAQTLPEVQHLREDKVDYKRVFKVCQSQSAEENKHRMNFAFVSQQKR
ncbi:MAG: hypothetical protein DWQ04_30360 [Chloroflexi bacterium]|nr:MAG: hypothetical protein DWQ04_30360 [Chloroflexota bacterium]